MKEKELEEIFQRLEKLEEYKLKKEEEEKQNRKKKLKEEIARLEMEDVFNRRLIELYKDRGFPFYEDPFKYDRRLNEFRQK